MTKFHSTTILCVLLAALFLHPHLASAQDALTVDPNGNVGIGTTTPIGQLHLNSNSGNYTRMHITNSDTGSAMSDGLLIGLDDAEQGHIDLRENKKLYFTTNGSIRMTIANDGKVGIGTGGSPNAKLHIQQTADWRPGLVVSTDSTATFGFVVGNTDVDSSITDGFAVGVASGAIVNLYARSAGEDAQFAFHTGDQERMRITSAGDVSIGYPVPSYKLDVNGTIRGSNVSPSDLRWKKDVKELDNALDGVSQLRGVNFSWKDKEKGENPQIGVIAQEVERVFPEAVSTDNKGYKSVSYDQLVAVLIEAVKELKAENDNLRATLRAENKELKDRIAALEGNAIDNKAISLLTTN